MKTEFLFALVFVGLFLCTACSTAGLESFEVIEKDMTKTQVLDELGSPYKSDRVDGTDIYVYRFYEDDGAVYREVQIEDDYVTYAGETTGKRSSLFPSSHRTPNKKSLERALKMEKKKQADPSFEDVE